MNAPSEQIVEYLATGPALARRLRMIGGIAETGFLPRCAGKIISDALGKAEMKLRRLAALEALQTAIDPDALMSTWRVCGLIADAIERFEAAGYRRVSAGYRQPTEVEALLVALIECDGPKTQRKLFAELTEQGQ